MKIIFTFLSIILGVLSMDTNLECMICYDTYDERFVSTNTGKLIILHTSHGIHHDVCEECVLVLIKNDPNILKCPKCRHILDLQEENQLPKTILNKKRSKQLVMNKYKYFRFLLHMINLIINVQTFDILLAYYPVVSTFQHNVGEWSQIVVIGNFPLVRALGARNQIKLIVNFVGYFTLKSAFLTTFELMIRRNNIKSQTIRTICYSVFTIINFFMVAATYCGHSRSDLYDEHNTNSRLWELVHLFILYLLGVEIMHMG